MRARRILSIEEVSTVLRAVTNDEAEIHTALDALFDPACKHCGTKIRVEYDGPCCHACYDKLWKKQKRISSGPNADLPFSVGDRVLWICRQSGKPELIPVSIEDISAKRVVIQVPGEVKVRRVLASELAKEK